MILILLMGGVFVCGLQALRARQLLACALWLAAVSALVAITFYNLGAPQAAAIELSVGAGLVTVLFVFAIGMAGDDDMRASRLSAELPRPVSWGLVLLAVGLLAWLLLRPATAVSLPAEASFAQVMWEQRSLDVVVQIGLIFSGVLGVLGLLSEPARQTAAPAAEQAILQTPLIKPVARTNGHQAEQAEVEKVPL